MNVSQQPVGDNSRPDQSLRLTLDEAVPLLHGHVERLGRDEGVRVLFMKGPVLAAQGLRPARVSIDVDVLVDPAAMRRLCSALEQLEWCVPVASTTARIVPQHSATYAHEAWPCTVDVHHRFPGFLAGPQVVFEALWARRTTANVAGREVPCCDVLGSAAILALHALRDPSRPHLQSELAHLVDVLNASIDDAGRAELAQLAAMTGASATLEPFLDAVGAPRTGREVVDSPELKAWRIRTAATGVKSVAWLAELSRTPLRRWIPTLWRAVTLTEAEIRHTYPEAAPGSWGLLRARMRRLRRGLVDLPKAARIVWRSGIASHPAGGRR